MKMRGKHLLLKMQKEFQTCNCMQTIRKSPAFPHTYIYLPLSLSHPPIL